MNDLIESLDSAKPLYILPRDLVVKEVLNPALNHTEEFDCMIGYFTSNSFSEIAPGLATYLSHTDKPLRLIISPYLNEQDRVAIEKGFRSPEQIAKNLISSDIPKADEIAQHTLECLSWLLYKERLKIKIALMKNALFHSKAWLFKQGEFQAALHGSMNFTNSALKRNREHLTLSRSWKGEESIYHIEHLREEFEILWRGGDEDCYVVDLPQAIEHQILNEFKGENMPTDENIESLWEVYEKASENIEEYKPTQTLRIPEYLEYRKGEYAHQGEAVDAWLENDSRGILEMATGSGKTITAMISATKLLEKTKKLLIVVAAPYKPLLEQWCQEIKEFNVTPTNLSKLSGANARNREIKKAIRKLSFGNSFVEVLVVSNDTLKTPEFISSISYGNIHRLLIADECHNLGAKSFINNPPEVFDFRMGLSATPIRQYDVEGTDELIKYFGDICYQFTLENAIGKCLTEYDYHVHLIELSGEEMERWYELTHKISSQAWKIESGEKDPYLDNLLRERRLVLETADEKVSKLKYLIDQVDPKHLKYTLIYSTSKDPDQLSEVNEVLSTRNIPFHQLTQEETASNEKTKEILNSFQKGFLKVLTAKKVLDEGVNIPQIKLAYILASTTVKREWIQRRGRLLRTCKEIGKTHAVIHDFVSIPPNLLDGSAVNLDADARGLIRSELERIWEFARLCRNGASDNGPYESVQYLQKLANEV